MKVEIKVTLKAGVLDPQGAALESALNGLGFEGISNVRLGKVIYMDVDAPDEETARAAVEQMCQKLLANTVVENFDIAFP